MVSSQKRIYLEITLVIEGLHRSNTHIDLFTVNVAYRVNLLTETQLRVCYSLGV